jgi:glycosyltransferase involved in cell wall biosynthesis
VRVIHFYNGLGGGIQTLISNLINYNISNDINYEIIYVIEKKNLNKLQKIPLIRPVNEKYLYYDSNWNIYYTLNKIAKMFHYGDILVAHDWIELGMVSQLKVDNPIISFLHGNYMYYYELYLRHRYHVNLFLSVTNSLVLKMLNEYYANPNQILHYRVPVKNITLGSRDYSSLKVLFIANDLNDSNKGFHLLPLIDCLLIERGVHLEWHIVGHWKYQSDLASLFQAGVNRIKYHGYISNDNLQNILEQVNIFLNCSEKEGIPISLIESMKSGLIPVVNNWSGSAHEIITNGIDGFIVMNNAPDDYVNVLYYLFQNLNQLPEIAQNASKTANAKHDFKKQIETFEDYLVRLIDIKCVREPQKIYGSFLDSPRIPNFITTSFRKIRKGLHG